MSELTITSYRCGICVCRGCYTYICVRTIPHKLGRLPYSYTGYHRIIENAANAAGLGRLGTHSFRHTFRSWLDAVGTALTVQQKLMRHADIQTTLNIYGDVVTDEMRQAGSKVAELALKSDSRLIPVLANNCERPDT